MLIETILFFPLSKQIRLYTMISSQSVFSLVPFNTRQS